MKAIVYRKYGKADVLHMEDVEKPAPGDHEVLIKVRAVSVNSWDWEVLRGRPIIARPGSGMFHPRRKILGADIAGEVEATGTGVTRFKPGDQVFGDVSGGGWGGLAEYVAASESALAIKPPGLSFEEAAAVPQAGVIALQALRRGGDIQPGEEVLVNGAGGGVGTFVTQLAKSWGGIVTGVDSAEKQDTMRAAGADTVLDYEKTDFARSGQRYDVVIDCQLHRWLPTCRRALQPGGKYVAIGGDTGKLMLLMSFGALLSRFSDKKTGLLIHRPNGDDLAEMGRRVESGEVKPMIDRTFTLADTAEAFRYFADGHVKGKIVITV